ncbi:MAG: hypothetical protein JXB88_25400 [Spirochaetales bacterium]|nr:hypothetical protein [Spirochaetales bacterium]
MVIIIKDQITDENLKEMQHTTDTEIIVDLKGISYITSNEISKLLVLYTNGKVIKLKNANNYIQERIRILKIEDIIYLIPPDKDSGLVS